MDLNMPEMDGEQATRETREGGIPTPKIALTAHLTAEDHARAAEAGFNDFQTKPLELDAPLAMIEELLSARKSICRLAQEIRPWISEYTSESLTPHD